MHTFRGIIQPDGTMIYYIGYFDQERKMNNWRAVGEVDNIEDAAAFVSYLNGGAEPKIKEAMRSTKYKAP